MNNITINANDFMNDYLESIKDSTMNLALEIEYSRLIFINGKNKLEYLSSYKGHPEKTIELDSNDFDRLAKGSFIRYVIREDDYLKVIELEKVVY